MKTSFLFLPTAALMVGLAFFMSTAPAPAMRTGEDLMSEQPENIPAAYFAGGCFWCVESELRALDGVVFTCAGYMGGDVENPTYKAVTTGTTGHAEVVEVTYDPEKTSFETLAEFFMTKAHDPTQLNRQGVDKGTQYRSAIFYVDDDQKAAADALIARLETDQVYDQPIVTEITAANTFWPAEDYHQQYYEKYEEETGKQHIRVIIKQQKKAAGLR